MYRPASEVQDDFAKCPQKRVWQVAVISPGGFEPAVLPVIIVNVLIPQGLPIPQQQGQDLGEFFGQLLQKSLSSTPEQRQQAQRSALEAFEAALRSGQLG